MTMTGLQKVAQYVAHDTKGQGVPFDQAFRSPPSDSPERPSFRADPSPPSPKAIDPNALAYRKAGPEPSWYQRNMIDLWKNRLAFRDMDAATARNEIPVGVDNPVPWANGFNYGKHNPFLYNMFVNPGHQKGQGHLGFGSLGGQGRRDQLLGSLGLAAAPFAGPSLLFNSLMGTDIGGKLDEQDYRGAAQSGAMLAVPYAGAAVGKKLLGAAAPAVTRLLTKSPSAIEKAKAIGEGVGGVAGMTSGIGAVTAHVLGKEWEEKLQNHNWLADEVSKTKALGFSPARGITHTVRSLPLKWQTEKIRRQLQNGEAVIQDNPGPLEPWNKYTVVPVPKATKAPVIPEALSEGAKTNWEDKILPWLKEHKTGLQVGAGAGSLGLIAYMIAKNRKRKQQEEDAKKRKQ